MEWRGAPLPRRSLHILDHPQCVLTPARFGVCVSEVGLGQHALGRERKSFFKLGYGFGVFALQIVAQRQVTLRGEETWIEFARLSGFLDGGFRIAREIVDPADMRGDGRVER